jgi:DNA-binding CsgD family transcriptional regulator
MPNQHSPFYLSAKKIWSTVVNENPSHPHELKLELDLHKRLLSLFQPGSYYYYVFNIFKAEFDVVSPGITNVLGYQPEEMTAAFFVDIVHPDDKPYFLQFERHITQFFKALPFEKIPKYKMQYDMRMLAKNNKYVRVLHQAVQIDYDETNYYRTLDVDTDITHIKPYGTPVFSIIGLDGEPSYFNVTDALPLKQSVDLFTRREREILKLIVENKSSRQIASMLYISLHTVNAHRKNILKKANASTTVNLVSKTIEQGWV